jgi:DNA polymerase-1
MRQTGKTLNFGIVYGMGARSFSKTCKIPLGEAKEFIAEYFRSFPSIKEWQDKTAAEAQVLGFITNINGRRRWFGQSTHPRVAAEVQRMAINMPIQSLGADIIKIAMARSLSFLRKEKMLGTKANLLLSIHDELLFEISDDILEKTTPPLEEIMSQAYALSVPLEVEIKQGKNWGQMKKIENV